VNTVSTSTDIPTRFRAVVAAAGDRMCIHGENGLSFAELDQRSDGVAAGLTDAGIGVGERVGLICPNGADFVTSYLGILKAGATVVPLNLLLNPREMAFILADSGAKGLIHHVAFEDAANQAAQGLDFRFRARIGDGAAPAIARLADLWQGPCEAVPMPALDPSDCVAAILYTSGTTGRPKGAMLTHANLTANVTSITAAVGMTEEDRLLVVLPMFHAFAATVGVLNSMLTGCSMISVARFEPRLVTQAVAEHKATLFLGVPSMYAVLLRLDDASVAQWQSVRLCVSGGAALPVAVMAAFESRFGIPVLEGDGPTECGPVTCVNPPEGPRKPGSVGPPVPGVEMCILDAQGQPLPDGEPGEVCVRGPSVMKGYFNLPEATREAFFGEWFRTGDLGTRDADGYFYLVDRIKDLIIVNGMNVYPRAIEEVLYQHKDVAEAAVVGDPDPRHGEIPVAHVVLNADADASQASAQLRKWCQERLGRHEIPRRFEFRTDLPKNAAGKILKRELRRLGEFERGIPPMSPAQGVDP
jgi:long-chain acyl-CoA synthetase